MRIGVRPLALVLCLSSALAQSGPGGIHARVILRGHVHPSARAEFDRGSVASDLRLDRMMLLLQPTAEQQADLDQLLEAQQDPESPQYRQWLTPEEYGRRFGLAETDLRSVQAWLEGQGLQVDAIPAGRNLILFSGAAGQVASAFRTPIHHYLVDGRLHYANAAEPQVPAALAPFVRGVVALHDFESAPQHVLTTPEYTGGSGNHYLSPQDWSTIYNVTPLYQQGLDGKGLSIAVLSRSNFDLQDVRSFRTMMALPASDPQIVLAGTDPGVAANGDLTETLLDTEWAGAIARNATVKVVLAKSVGSDGIALAAQYAVNNKVAPIITVSYGLCEAALGSSGNAFWHALWGQAHAQGITVFVSSGDSGAAGCDSPSASTATHAPGVNGMCSSPYSTCVGGTQFDDTLNPNRFWSAANGTGMSSALAYIPELPWNESGNGGLWAGGGGVSTIYVKPTWQNALGVPADGKRDVPDISASAAGHDAYVVQVKGSTGAVSGTSAAAPAIASAMLLAVQKNGTGLGAINPVLYSLGNLQWGSGGTAVYHDITSGNIAVPGTTGFKANAGYDVATGLGTPNFGNLIPHWNDALGKTFSLGTSPSSVTLTASASTTSKLTLNALGGFNSPVTLTSSGAPAGVGVTLSSGTITGDAPVTVTVGTSANAAAATSTITFTGVGGGLTRTGTLSVNVVVPTFTLSSNSSAVGLTAGAGAQVVYTTAVLYGFKSAVAMSITGTPPKVTANFSPANIATPVSGSSTLTLSAASGVAPGVYNLTVTASGGGVTKTLPLTLTVTAPRFSMVLGTASVTLPTGSTLLNSVLTQSIDGFKSAIALSTSALPAGVSASFSPASIASPGTGLSTLNLNVTAAANPGTYTIQVIGTGSGITVSTPLTVVVPAPTFTLSVGAAKVSLNRGGYIPVYVSTSISGSMKQGVALTVTGLPAGVTGVFNPATIPAPGAGLSSLTLTATSTAATGTFNLTVTAKSGDVTRTQNIALTVNAR